MYKGPIEIIAEECCEECHETIHNHMGQCPVCGEQYAGTDQYCSLREDESGVNDRGRIEIGCENCGAQFEDTADDPSPYNGEDVWLQIK